MDFSKSHAVVSGGASGLGAATAEAVITAGGRVTILDRDVERGQARAKALGERARFQQADVTDEEEIERAVAGTVEAFGPLTLAVSCAGIATPGRVLGKEGPLKLDTYKTVVMINLIGTFNFMKASAQAMQTNETDEDGCRGVVVNTASVAAYEGQIGQAAYASSKGGVVGLTLPAARDLASVGIRVATIAPGLFMTPMMAGLPEKVQQSLAESTPFPKRLGKAEEYAQTVADIYRNNMLNGCVIRLDGAVRLAPR